MQPTELAEHLKTLNVSTEDVIEAARLLAKADQDQYIRAEGLGADVLIIHCIQACIQHLERASLAIYASYK